MPECTGFACGAFAVFAVWFVCFLLYLEAAESGRRGLKPHAASLILYVLTLALALAATDMACDAFGTKTAYVACSSAYVGAYLVGLKE